MRSLFFIAALFIAASTVVLSGATSSHACCLCEFLGIGCGDTSCCNSCGCGDSCEAGCGCEASCGCPCESSCGCGSYCSAADTTAAARTIVRGGCNVPSSFCTSPCGGCGCGDCGCGCEASCGCPRCGDSCGCGDCCEASCGCPCGNSCGCGNGGCASGFGIVLRLHAMLDGALPPARLRMLRRLRPRSLLQRMVQRPAALLRSVRPLR